MTSPISRLHDDVLLHIFDLNASIQPEIPLTLFSHDRSDELLPDNPLYITLTASQVCQAWRHLLIESPTIWGKLFDLDVLFTRGSLRKTILSRTCDAPLWVRGSETVRRRNPRPGEKQWRTNKLLMGFVEEEWPRIHSIDITPTSSAILTKLWHAVINRAAPQLKYFRILPWSYALAMSNRVTVGQQIFSGCAPSLRSFSCGLYRFDLRSSWIAQLTRFHYRPCESILPTTFAELFHAISRMALLEDLSLILMPSSHCIIDGSEADIQPVALSNLRQVYFASTTEICTLFYDKIIIPEVCLPRLAIFSAIGGLSSPKSVTLFQRFIALTNRYGCTSYPNFTSIRLRLSATSFSLSAKPSPSWDVPPRNPFNDMPFVLFLNDGLPHASRASLPQFQFPSRTGITHFSFLLKFEDVKEFPARSDLEKFMRNFQKVTHLQASRAALLFLGLYGVSLFPALEVIAIKEAENDHVVHACFVKFRQDRSALDYPPFQVMLVRYIDDHRGMAFEGDIITF